MAPLKEKYQDDKKIWDECSLTYEQRIVGGHPDIFAFECFEEVFLDQVLHHLAENFTEPIKLMDVGCGSGRLHLRYGVKTANPLTHPEIHTKAQGIRHHCEMMYDPVLAERLHEVWGIDFSSTMIKLADDGIKSIGLEELELPILSLAEGSAFELAAETGNHIPIIVCLVNSIGVMQGPDGAVALFKSMRHAVERAGGIAIISCYRKRFLRSYGLNQYESTMDVSGQPVWVVPDTYATGDYVLQPKAYKRAHCMDPTIPVSVIGRDGNVIESDVLLERDPARTNETLESGHIRTHAGYESNWYSFQQIDEWINEYWGENTYHLKAGQLDALRGEPAQLAILDCNRRLPGLLKRWNIA